MTAAEFLDGLDAARAAATPGPWTAATAPSEDSNETHAEYLTSALRPEEGRPLWVAWAPAVDGLHDTDYVVPIVTGDGPTSEANATFVTLAHDALPKLTAALRAVEALAERFGWDTMREPDWTGQQVAAAIRTTVADALADES